MAAREALFRYRVIGFLLRHPNRFAMAVAEFFRPGTLGWKLDNAWFQIRHHGDFGAWRAKNGL